MSFGHGVPLGLPREHHDEYTVLKVYDALREEAGLNERQARDSIEALRKKGIIFREKLPMTPGPTCRGEKDSSG
jgi:hypothetical protein